jgi:hypothetical protein
MAKIQEEIIVIKVSRLLRDSETGADPIMPAEAVDSLEAVIQELAGSNTLVEIARE